MKSSPSSLKKPSVKARAAKAAPAVGTRQRAASSPGVAPNIARIPITNVYMGGDYTGVIFVGPSKKPLNVILDTGSSALALDAKKYQPDVAHGDQTTNLAQTDSYGDGSSWTGAVIQTSLTIGTAPASITLPGGNAAVAYQASADMFGETDGILGLAYAELDDAFQLPADTWKGKFPSAKVRTGKPAPLVPYLTQLAAGKVTSDKIAFYTRRSFVHVGAGTPADDPLNQGWMIVGGGEESTDLYTGNFQSVKVLSDSWYCTNVTEVVVGSTSPIAARLQGPPGMPSNSIIDSGTNSLSLGPQMLEAILTKLTPSQAQLLGQAVKGGKLVPVSQLKLAQWPTISFVLQGDAGDVKLDVPASNYWQVDTQQVGYAAAAITLGQAGLAILGLPLMNGYFTIFDGEADGGMGAVKFAAAR